MLHDGPCSVYFILSSLMFSTGNQVTTDLHHQVASQVSFFILVSDSLLTLDGDHCETLCNHSLYPATFKETRSPQGLMTFFLLQLLKESLFPI